MNLIVRPATLQEAEALGPRLRPEDKQEVETATGMTAGEVVPASLLHSHECYTVRLSPHEEPCVIFGMTEDGLVWMLCTDDIRKAPLSILREARAWIDHWMSYCGYLWNLVDSRNTLHVRWLTLLGFTFGEPIDVNGFPFLPFSKVSDVRTN